MDHEEWRNKGNSSQKKEDNNNDRSLSETESDENQVKKIIKDSPDKRTNDDSDEVRAMYWLPIGIALGVAIGISTNQLSLWLSLGIAVGIMLSFVSKKNWL